MVKISCSEKEKEFLEKIFENERVTCEFKECAKNRSMSCKDCIKDGLGIKWEIKE